MCHLTQPKGVAPSGEDGPKDQNLVAYQINTHETGSRVTRKEPDQRQTRPGLEGEYPHQGPGEGRSQGQGEKSQEQTRPGPQGDQGETDLGPDEMDKDAPTDHQGEAGQERV